jgi:disulfide bond formation protein DsbB
VASIKLGGPSAALLGLVLGMAFAAAGWWLHAKQQPFPDGVTAQAKVTAVHTVQSGTNRRTTSYARVVTFTDKNGKQVTFTEGTSSGKYPDVGQAVQVSYRPSDPQSARILAGRNGWDFMSISVFGWGMFCVLVSLLILVRRLL